MSKPLVKEAVDPTREHLMFLVEAAMEQFHGKPGTLKVYVHPVGNPSARITFEGRTRIRMMQLRVTKVEYQGVHDGHRWVRIEGEFSNKDTIWVTISSRAPH